MNVLLQDSAYTPSQNEPCFLFARRRSTLSDTVFYPELRKTFYLNVSGKIGGIDANILIDTGSAITVINQDLLDKVRENSNSSLKTTGGQYQTAQTASGEIVHVLGDVNLKLSLGNATYTVKTCVLPKLHYMAILGKDFLERFDCVIDFNSGYLKIARDNLVLFNTSNMHEIDTSNHNATFETKDIVPDSLPFADIEPEIHDDSGYSVHAADTYIISPNSE